jgi:hypothetical protein
MAILHKIDDILAQVASLEKKQAEVRATMEQLKRSLARQIATELREVNEPLDGPVRLSVFCTLLTVLHGERGANVDEIMESQSLLEVLGLVTPGVGYNRFPVKQQLGAYLSRHMGTLSKDVRSLRYTVKQAPID